MGYRPSYQLIFERERWLDALVALSPYVVRDQGQLAHDVLFRRAQSSLTLPLLDAEVWHDSEPPKPLTAGRVQEEDLRVMMGADCIVTFPFEGDIVESGGVRRTGDGVVEMGWISLLVNSPLDGFGNLILRANAKSQSYYLESKEFLRVVLGVAETINALGSALQRDGFSTEVLWLDGHRLEKPVSREGHAGELHQWRSIVLKPKEV